MKEKKIYLLAEPLPRPLQVRRTGNRSRTPEAGRSLKGDYYM